MYGQEHYLSKIERNANVAHKAPQGVKEQCIQHIKWARTLASRLNQLDYQERENAISKIHQIMDDDYIKMGFNLTVENEPNKIVR